MHAAALLTILLSQLTYAAPINSASEIAPKWAKYVACSSNQAVSCSHEAISAEEHSEASKRRDIDATDFFVTTRITNPRMQAEEVVQRDADSTTQDADLDGKEILKKITELLEKAIGPLGFPADFIATLIRPLTDFIFPDGFNSGKLPNLSPGLPVGYIEDIIKEILTLGKTPGPLG